MQIIRCAAVTLPGALVSLDQVVRRVTMSTYVRIDKRAGHDSRSSWAAGTRSINHQPSRYTVFSDSTPCLPISCHGVVGGSLTPISMDVGSAQRGRDDDVTRPLALLVANSTRAMEIERGATA